MNFTRSNALWKAANQALPGGVNSPVRAFKAVGGEPFFAESGQGAWITDADGNQYVDYVLSWGPLILGHAHPEVVARVHEALNRGASFGIPTESETRLAEKLVEHVPSIEKVRLVNSGTEATMSAIRLARAHTGRDICVKVEGCYHGHADGLLVKAGSGLTTFGTPTSPGVPEAYASCTLTIPFNDVEAVKSVFEAHGDNVACLIVEPVAGNMGVIPPEDGYLEELRRITQAHGSLLIFDEVMTGFRVSLGGAQAHYGVTPDLTCLGKVVGGGMPIGAYGGPADIMDQLSPAGPVYQAGTLSGNPLATAAGLATIEVIEQPGAFEAIEANMLQLTEELGRLAAEADVPIYQTQAGTMACAFFQEGPVHNYADATQSDTDRYARFFWGMLQRGVYIAPAQFEAMFYSAAHGDNVFDHTCTAAREAFKEAAG